MTGPFYEVFTSPGTWTCPPVVKSVEVWVVGGGGGGWLNPLVPAAYGGGGGAVVRKVLPVSGPVPITVGSGGAGASGGPTFSGGTGGISGFGPLGPGPEPLIPATTVAAGGGGGAGGPGNAPPIGGGGGSGGSQNYGGAYGYYGGNQAGGGTRSSGQTGSPLADGGLGKTLPLYGYQFGAGGRAFIGNRGRIVSGSASWDSPSLNSPAVPNSGGGGAGTLPGAAGIVIVRSWR